MDDQPKLLPQPRATFFYDGSGMRLPVEGTVARSELHEDDDAFFKGMGPDGKPVTTIPVAGRRRASSARRRALRDLLPALPRRAAATAKGILFQRGNVPTSSFHSGQGPRLHRRPDLRHHDQRLRPDAVLSSWPIPPADRWAIIAHIRELSSGARRGDRAESDRHDVRQRLKIAAAAVLAVLALVATARVAVVHGRKHEYKDPERVAAVAVDTTPARAGVDRREAAARTRRTRAKPYVEAEYRAFPKIGSRVAIWIVAQLHLLFAAFVLAVPIFALIIEFIGYKTKDKRYDQLAYEFTEAAVGVVLADGDVRRGAHVHARSSCTRSSRTT